MLPDTHLLIFSVFLDPPGPTTKMQSNGKNGKNGRSVSVIDDVFQTDTSRGVCAPPVAVPQVKTDLHSLHRMISGKSPPRVGQGASGAPPAPTVTPTNAWTRVKAQVLGARNGMSKDALSTLDRLPVLQVLDAFLCGGYLCVCMCACRGWFVAGFVMILYSS